MRHVRLLGVVSPVLVAVMANTGLADLWTAYEDASQFGNLNQRALTTLYSTDNLPGQSPQPIGCGPTSVTNALVYLQNAYANIYDSNLIQNIPGNTAYQNLVATAYELADNMRTSTTSPYTDVFNYLLGTRSYIESVSPGVTSYAAMNEWRWGGPDWTLGGLPTWDFLYNGLHSGAAVGVLLYHYYNDQGTYRWSGHFVGLSGITWDDQTNSGKVAIVDPLWGIYTSVTIFESSNVTFTSNGELVKQVETKYWGNDHTYIAEAMVLSPALAPVGVPEPSSAVLTGMAVLVLAGCGWRHRRRQAG